MKRGVVACLGVTAVLSLCLPAIPAAAAPGSYISEAGHVTRFHLQGSNGYRISVSSNARRYFTLTARKAGIEIRYSTRARRTDPLGVRAKLAGLGRVDVQFRPSGPGRQFEPYSNCDGPGPTVQPGVVRGQVIFRGEDGYTAVEAQRIKAEVVSWTKQRCRYVVPGLRKRQKRLAARFYAVSRFGGFSAYQYLPRFRPRSRRAVFTASTGSIRGKLRIFRSVRATSDPSSFHFPEGHSNPEHLILEPPPPFSGTGTMQRTPESVFTWEGPLSVTFPGVSEPVQLTGSEFNFSYCALRGCINQSSQEGPGFF